MNQVGTYSVTYKVTDSKGASSVKTITIIVKAQAAIPGEKPENKPANPTRKSFESNSSPQTGDESNLDLLGLIFAGSGGMLFGLIAKNVENKWYSNKETTSSNFNWKLFLYY